VNSNANAAYAENTGSGYLLFARGTTLVGQSFNPSTRQLAGAPFPAAEQILVNMASGLGRAMFSASANGVLVYRTGVDTGSTELVWFDRHGNRLGRVGEPGDYSNPALSPDENKLAVAVMDSETGTRDLWLMDLIRETSSRFTFNSADETNPVWSPDGTRLVFTTVRKGRPEIYQKGLSGTSEPTPFLDSGQSMSIQNWSRDGRFLVYRTSQGIWVKSLADGHASAVLLGEGTGKMSNNAEVSPNGRWVAYQLNEPNRSDVFVESLKPNGGKWQVSTSGGMEPHWRRDGKELFYIAGQKLMAVEVKGDAGVFEVASPKSLFEVRLENIVRRSRYQVATNGQRFLINVPVQASSPFTVAVNWTAGRRP
jgi:Tol biopolymer transport system component